MSNIISTLLIMTLIVMTFLVISSRASGGEPEIFGYQLKTVLSGSMEPTFHTGSIILVKKLDEAGELAESDIITYLQENEQLVTHRIIEVVQQGESVLYRTKGDSNENPDTNLVLSENVVALYTGVSIPLVGYVLSYAGSPLGVAILLIAPGLLLIGYSIVTIRQAVKEIDAKTKALQASEKGETVS